MLSCSSNKLRSIDVFVPSEILNKTHFKGYMCNWRVTGNRTVLDYNLFMLTLLFI